MTTVDRRWPAVLPVALSVFAAVELAAYLLFAPVTTTPAGESAGALAAGNAFLVGLAVVVVAAAAVGTVAAVREWRQGVWLAAAALALVGVAGVAVGPQILAVALLLVVGALVGEAADEAAVRRDGTGPRRDGTDPGPADREVVDHTVEDVTVEPPPPERDVPPAVDQHPPPDRLGGPPGGSDVEAGTAGEDDGAGEGGVESGEAVGSGAGAGEERVEGPSGAVEEEAGSWPGDALGWEPDGPEREVVIAGLLLVPLAALLGVSALTTPVAQPVVAATAVVVFAGAGAAVVAAARE